MYDDRETGAKRCFAVLRIHGDRRKKTSTEIWCFICTSSLSTNSEIPGCSELTHTHTQVSLSPPPPPPSVHDPNKEALFLDLVRLNLASGMCHPRLQPSLPIFISPSAGAESLSLPLPPLPPHTFPVCNNPWTQTIPLQKTRDGCEEWDVCLHCMVIIIFSLDWNIFLEDFFGGLDCRPNQPVTAGQENLLRERIENTLTVSYLNVKYESPDRGQLMSLSLPRQQPPGSEKRSQFGRAWNVHSLPRPAGGASSDCKKKSDCMEVYGEMALLLTWFITS